MITFKLQILLFLGTMLFMGFVIMLLRKEKIELKYTLLWFFLSFALIALSLFPKITIVLSHTLGIGLPVNAIFLVIMSLIILILMSLTIVVSKLNQNNVRLAQEIALLKLELIDDGIKKRCWSKRHQRSSLGEKIDSNKSL
jgi:hypothetical protein